MFLFILHSNLFWQGFFEDLGCATKQEYLFSIISGRNGLIEFQTIASKNGWIVLASETFVLTDHPLDLDVKPQLKRIRSLGNVISFIEADHMNKYFSFFEKREHTPVVTNLDFLTFSH